MGPTTLQNRLGPATDIQNRLGVIKGAPNNGDKEVWSADDNRQTFNEFIIGDEGGDEFVLKAETLEATGTRNDAIVS